MADLSTVHGRLNGADLELFDQASGNTVLAFRNSIGSLPVVSSADAQTAHGGGGQANATPITTQIARFTTVVTAGDSAVLPKATPGLEITVINAHAANALDVFPASGDQINALGVNAEFTLAATKVVTFYSPVAGQWHSQLSA